MSTKKIVDEISVFFPAYNEEKNINKTVDDAIRILKKLAHRFEIIIVDDGSKDKTGYLADKLAENKDNFVRVIHHQTNQGYGESLKSGFYSSKYKYIATVDSDGQFDFSEITKLLDKIKLSDLVIGYRINRQDPIIRKIFGLGWTFLANILLNIKVRDVDCAFKLIKKEVLLAIPKLESTRGGMISPELLAKAKKRGFNISQVGVHHLPRKEGRQTGADFAVIYRSFLDLLKLWQKIK